MTATLIRAATVVCVVGAVACSRAGDSRTSATIATPDTNVAGTSGTDAKEPITATGCVVSGAGGYVLTSLDDAIVRQERGTSGFRDDPDSKPSDPNRKDEEERLRYSQNVSAGFSRYQLTGNTSHIATFVNREVDITGRVLADDGSDKTPMTLNVESIHETGAACGQAQRQGNERQD
jgi:hypothetical protein